MYVGPFWLQQVLIRPRNSEYWPNIDHTALYRPNFDHKSSLKSAHVFTRFATKVRMFIRAGLYPTSQEIQGAGRYFHMTSFNGRVHFEVLRFVIFQIIGKIYHHSEIFWWYIDHFNAISTKNSRISTISAKWSIMDQWSIISTQWPSCSRVKISSKNISGQRDFSRINPDQKTVQALGAINI